MKPRELRETAQRVWAHLRAQRQPEAIPGLGSLREDMERGIRYSDVYGDWAGLSEPTGKLEHGDGVLAQELAEGLPVVARGLPGSPLPAVEGLDVDSEPTGDLGLGQDGGREVDGHGAPVAKEREIQRVALPEGTIQPPEDTMSFGNDHGAVPSPGPGGTWYRPLHGGYPGTADDRDAYTLHRQREGARPSPYGAGQFQQGLMSEGERRHFSETLNWNDVVTVKPVAPPFDVQRRLRRREAERAAREVEEKWARESEADWRREHENDFQGVRYHSDEPRPAPEQTLAERLYDVSERLQRVQRILSQVEGRLGVTLGPDQNEAGEECLPEKVPALDRSVRALEASSAAVSDASVRILEAIG